VDVDPGFDQITAAWPGQFALRVCKQLSTYNVRADEFIEGEIVGRWGCLASKSLAFTPAGPIYLSAGGVVQETDGQFLERTIVPGIISEKLQNFRDKTAAELKNAAGEWLPREQQYWLNIGDTTFVWDWLASKRLKTNVWTTNSIDFAGGTLYDGDDDYEVIPGRSFYFWRDNDCRIYRFGQGITNEEYDYYVDTGGTTNIAPVYKTGNLLWGEQASQIRGYGMLVEFEGGVVDSSETLVIYAHDHFDTSQASTSFNKLYNRFIKEEVTVDPALYYRLRIAGVLSSGTYIEALDVYYRPDAERIVFQ
jgi:hypothetical protein